MNLNSVIAKEELKDTYLSKKNAEQFYLPPWINPNPERVFSCFGLLSKKMV